MNISRINPRLFQAAITIILAWFVLLSFGCSSQLLQVYETKPASNQFSGNTFENDTVQISYYFWWEHGIMAFSIYNKLNKPIYIDWKNSSFILNGIKLDYWTDEQIATSTGVYAGYYYSGPLVAPGLGVNAGVVVTEGNIVKPERVTFIPPKSTYSKSDFFLFPDSFIPLGSDATETIENRNDKPKKTTVVTSKEFNESSTPAMFRNYLALTFAETSTDYAFIDNGFYVSAVREMDSRHFLGKKTGWDSNGVTLYEKPFKNARSFYTVVKVVSSGPPQPF